MKSNRVLTDAAIKRIRPPETSQIEHFDAALPGFAVRVSATGAKSYTCHYRLHGKLRRDTLGKVGVFSLKDARDEARQRILKAQGGVDPRPLKFKAERDSVQSVVEEFIERHAKRHNRTWRETKRLFEREVLPKWGDRPLRSIARRDVIALLDDIADRPAPIMANRTLAAVRKLFNWALSRDILDASPVTKVTGPGKETRRDRVLSEDEVRAIWNAATEYPWGAFVRL
ncbi:MAG TPA: integrase family protein, partial [Kiloniellales bacterium]